MSFTVHERYTYYSAYCDAVGCNAHLELAVPVERYTDDYDIDLDGDTGCVEYADGDYEGDDLRGYFCESEQDALRIAVQHGWQEGSEGVQRVHMYCPGHTEETE
ncbi:hypothetical protein BW14_07100 [Bifidobacterium sp. UTBIF-68]|nr:hypothetical protein BW14_07100 [Bifidobacterium sp. UTBIF-68]